LSKQTKPASPLSLPLGLPHCYKTWQTHSQPNQH
jgi:hypothetical protein